MFPSAQSVTEMSKNSCKFENCKQKKELPVTAVTCDRSVKCERVWISSVPERPEVPVQTDSPGAPCGEEEGSVVELNHSCQSGKWIVTCLERGSDERGHTVTCRLSVTDTHTAYRIPGLVWTALVRSAMHGPAATRHPVSHWANISLPTETKEHLRCLTEIPQGSQKWTQNRSENKARWSPEWESGSCHETEKEAVSKKAN